MRQRWSSILSVTAVALSLAVAFAGCSGSESQAEAVPVPKGARGDAPPTTEAAEVCGAMIRAGVELEVAPLSEPPVGSVKRGVYSCLYRTEQGEVALRVRDLGTIRRARQRLESGLKTVDVADQLPGLGDAGYFRDDGSAVVRKDEFLLIVDPTQLPIPTEDNAAIAFSLSTSVMGCW